MKQRPLRHWQRLGALLAVLAAAMVALALAAAAQPSGPTSASARLQDTDGRGLGTVRFSTEAGKVTVSVDVSRVAPSDFHGFHIHAVGACDPAGGFTSAGGHFNPLGATHGHHAGDMPPLLVNSDGRAGASFVTDSFAVADLFDSDGSAVILHAGPDNLAHIPTRYHSHDEDVFGPDSATLATGDAGARLACGVVVTR